MLKIRLKRIGRRHDPTFRVVVIDSRQGPKSGKYLEALGTHDPRVNAHTLVADRIRYWLGQGAQPSETVHNLLVDEGIIEGAKVNPLPKKTPLVKEAGEAAPAENAGSETPDKQSEAPAEETTEPAAADEPSEEAPAAEVPTPEPETTEGKEEKEEEKTA